MSTARTLAIAKRIINQFLHDYRTLGLLFVVPVVILTLVGLLFRAEVQPMALGVVNEDQGASSPAGTVSLARGLVDSLGTNKDIVVVRLERSAVEDQVKNGKVKGAVVFGPDFSKEVLARKQPNVAMILEGSNPAVSGNVMMALTRSLREAAPALLSAASGQANAAGLAGEPFKLDAVYLYGGQAFDQLDYFAPVAIGYFAFFFVFLLASVSFLRERSQGTLERLMASPISRAEITVGYMLGFSVFAIIQAAVLLLFAVYVIQIHHAGNLLIVFVIEIVLTVGAVNLGIFLSTFTRNELQVLQFIPMVIIPQGLLSGIFWPVADMPVVLKELAYVMPITYANFALRDVMIKGLGLGEPQVLFNLAMLVVFAALMLAFASLTLRRQVA
ncbi:MAG: ABC transporter permease [Dehalococcoidia bacterium]|nr:ABC transporter permease [Dehalococcoidia bacterium]